MLPGSAETLDPTWEITAFDMLLERLDVYAKQAGQSGHRKKSVLRKRCPNVLGKIGDRFHVGHSKRIEM